MKNLFFCCFLILPFLSCVTSGESDTDYPIIDIEEGLGNFQISQLSEFASSVRYVRLETHEDFLVTNGIKNIYVEDNKIFIHDGEPYLKVFDAGTGKYLYNIGAKGQGPGELPYMYAVDINPHESRILLCWGKYMHCFDFDGNFLGKIELPYINDNEQINGYVVSIDEHLFAGRISYYGEDQENSVVIFDANQEITGSLKCYDNPTQHPDPKFVVWSPFDQGGLFYRTGKNIRYFRGFTDTVFTYNQEKIMFEPYFVFDYGKHKSRLNFNPDTENPDLIKVSSIKEDDRYIFLHFNTMNASPEPYEDEIYINGSVRKFINHSISGIFDKQDESFHFLLQPVPGIPGLKNDIDGGIPFFVRNVSSNGQLIDYYQSYKFLEHVESLPDPSDSFMQIVNQISEEDNPIVMIAE